MNPNGQPQEPCVKLEICYYPQRASNNVVVNGPVDDQSTCFVLLGMGQRALHRHWDRREADSKSAIVPAIAIPKRH